RLRFGRVVGRERLVRPEVPRVPTGIAGAVVPGAVLGVAELHHDLCAGRTCPCAVLVRILDDDVDAVAGGRGGRAHRAEHDHAVSEADLGVLDRPVFGSI